MTAGARLGAAFPEVLTAAQAGGAWAFERLWTSLAPAVTGYLRVQGAREPEDLASEVFLNVFRGLGRFAGGEEQFRSWVFTIAHRRLTDERRRRGRRPDPRPLDDLPNETAGAAPAAEHPALDALATARVQAVCERLVPDQRDVLLLRLVAGLTVDEIAAALEKSPGAVKALQRRGLAAIEKIFSNEGVPL